MDLAGRRWDDGHGRPEPGIPDPPSVATAIGWIAGDRLDAATLCSILSKLIGDASAALDHDRDKARELLGRATALLRSGVARADRSGPVRTASLRPWQARRIADHIEDNLERSLPLDELAGVVKLSNSYFSRAFKGAFAQTPHAFILRRRVERARREMSVSREPLSQIALSCGFADQAHLARIFRRETGLSPSEWRRANQPAGEALRARTIRGSDQPFGGTMARD